MPSLGAPQALKDFKIPGANSGHGNQLHLGRGVSVYYDLQPPNVWPEHEHATAQIIIALEAVPVEMKWSRAGQSVSATHHHPHVWFVPPRTPHALEWRGTAAMLVLFVETDFIREECGRDLTEGGALLLNPLVRQDFLVARLCRKFHELCHRKRTYSALIKVAGATMLAPLLLRRYFDRSAEGSGPARGLSETRLQKVTDEIEKRLHEPLSPAILARIAGLTESHFSLKFRISTGLPPMKYIWRCRIHKARQMLETGDWKVAAVSAEMGFFDQSHLDRQFRKEFDCSPGSVIPHRRERR